MQWMWVRSLVEEFVHMLQGNKPKSHKEDSAHPIFLLTLNKIGDGKSIHRHRGGCDHRQRDWTEKQATESQQPAEAGRGKRPVSCPEHPEGSLSPGAWLHLDFRSPDPGENELMLLKSHSLWSSVQLFVSNLPALKKEAQQELISSFRISPCL